MSPDVGAGPSTASLTLNVGRCRDNTVVSGAACDSGGKGHGSEDSEDSPEPPGLSEIQYGVIARRIITAGRRRGQPLDAQQTCRNTPTAHPVRCLMMESSPWQQCLILELRNSLWPLILPSVKLAFIKVPLAFYHRGNVPAAALATPPSRRGQTPPRERFFERPEMDAGFTFFFHRLIWGGELRRSGCQVLMEVRKERTNRLLKSGGGMEEKRRTETSAGGVSSIFFVCYVCCHGSRPGSAAVPPNKANRGVPTTAFPSSFLFYRCVGTPGRIMVPPTWGGGGICFSRCCPTPSRDSVPALNPVCVSPRVVRAFPGAASIRSVFNVARSRSFDELMTRNRSQPRSTVLRPLLLVRSPRFFPF